MTSNRIIPSDWRRVLVAVLLVAVAAALRVWPLHALGSRLAWLTFYPVVMVAGIYGGLWSGLLTTGLACFTTAFLWSLIVDQPFIKDSADWLGMAVFCMTGTLMSLVAESRRRANLRAAQIDEKAADALKTIFAHQEAVLAIIPDIIMEVDDRRVYTWANPAGFEFFGDDVLGKEAAFFFEGEQETYKTVEPLFDGNEDVFYLESWQRRKDGEKRLLGWWCHVLKDKQGRATGALSTARDLTENRRAEEKIRSLARFPDENPNPVMRIAKAGTILYANAASGPLLRLLDRKIGQDLPEPWVSRVEAVHASAQEDVLEIEAEDRVFSCMLTPIAGADYVNIYGRDITARKSAEAELLRHQERLEELVKERTVALEVNNSQLAAEIMERRRAEEELRKLSRAVEQSPATVVITDVEGTIEYVNPKFVETTGYANEEAIGRNPRLLKSGTQSPAFYTELWRAIKAGNVWHGDFCNRKRNGELYFESAAIAPIRNEQGQITHFVAIKEDVTGHRRIADELRNAKDAAEAANRAKSDFLANMSHELRTPLGAIIGFSEILDEQLFGDLNHKQKEYVRDILNSGQHLLSLINDILDLAKIEAGKLALELSTFSLTTLLDNSLVMVKEKCLKHGIALSLDLPESIRDLMISADGRKLKQIMFNLLSNAAKFTPERGTITVSARQDGPDVMISVADTGIGISKEHQDSIFEEFYQVAGGPRGKTPGTGLGLALVKRMVELHRGRVWVESEGEGTGSTFRFTLPLQGHRPTPASDGDQRAPSAGLQRVSDFVDWALAGGGRFCLCRVEPTNRMAPVAQDAVIQEFNHGKRGNDTVMVDTDGDFVLLLTNTDRAGAEAAVERLAAGLEARLGIGWRRAVAVCPDDGQTAEALMEVLRHRCGRSQQE